MNWISAEGKTKRQLLNKIILENSIDHQDMGTHVWVARINNRGTSLICYATGKVDGVWYYKMITEDVGPDVYDCPMRLIDACVPRNIGWRTKVYEWHNENGQRR